MTEMELKLAGGRIVSAELKDGVLKILVEETKEESKLTPEVLETEVAPEDVISVQFIRVPASSLSLTDNFMLHCPQSFREEAFKELLTKVIKSGVSDFYRPRLDPSFDRQGKICYQAGLKPAVGKSYDWWESYAKKFCPERSRLGTVNEYVAFLGVLLKSLVDCGWEVVTAWNAVCKDSKNLGHYYNSVGALRKFEPTGSREICGFCDLANTYKILAKDKEVGGFWLAGGFFNYFGDNSPIADLSLHDYHNFTSKYSVGWIVLEA